jgi:uncharacterized membrane protein YqjE
MADDIRIQPRDRGDIVDPDTSPDREPSLGTLFKQLADDSRILIRQEVSLAKAEIGESALTLAKNGLLIGLGTGMLAVGLLVLTAFLVLGLARLLDGNYWLSSLIVGGTLGLIGGITVLAGKRGLQQDEVRPEQTVESVRETRDWAQAEAEQVKRNLAT